jgi:hypothetical protein
MTEPPHMTERYSFTILADHAYMRPDSNGEWVRHNDLRALLTDYAVLHAEREILQERVIRYRKALEEIANRQIPNIYPYGEYSRRVQAHARAALTPQAENRDQKLTELPNSDKHLPVEPGASE